jgi:hypothetical protein
MTYFCGRIVLQDVLFLQKPSTSIFVNEDKKLQRFRTNVTTSRAHEGKVDMQASNYEETSYSSILALPPSRRHNSVAGTECFLVSRESSHRSNIYSTK